MHHTINILDIPLSNITKSDLLEILNGHFANTQKSLFIVTANPEIIMAARTSTAYSEVLKTADYILPDGIGVMIGSKILNQPLKQKLPGYELMLDFLAYAAAQRKSVYFYGAKPGYATQAASNAVSLYPGLRIAGATDGYRSDKENAAAEIAALQPDFIFVAMGAPIQEDWIARYRHLFPTSVLMGVGGSIDVLSGNVKRAPQFWVKNNLEWLYRLISQPARAKRMMKIPAFLFLVFKKRVSRKMA